MFKATGALSIKLAKVWYTYSFGQDVDWSAFSAKAAVPAKLRSLAASQVHLADVLEAEESGVELELLNRLWRSGGDVWGSRPRLIGFEVSCIMDLSEELDT